MTTLPSVPNLAIVGATGAVGRELLAILEERRFPHGMLRLLASDRSTGMMLPYAGASIPVEPLGEGSFADIDLAIFSSGNESSRAFVPRAIEAGAVVIDNSSAFRMDPHVPLIVPEINGNALHGPAQFRGGGGRLIANPNCTTIIILLAVTPLHRIAGITRMVVSTYQAASGAGAAWMNELEQQARDFAAGQALTTSVTGRQYLFNVFNHNSPIGDDGSNEEERKLLRETHRIWDDDRVRIAATCIRVPVLRSHAAAVNLTFASPLTEDRARAALASAPGVQIVDDRAANHFPEPINSSGRDEVLVGRIRADHSQPLGMGLSLFVAGDQLRKGAALNAIQIAERLMTHAEIEIKPEVRARV